MTSEEDFETIKGGLLDSLLSKSFEIHREDEKESELVYLPPVEGIAAEDFPLVEEIDRDILMHRDAHFSGNFDLMQEYYENEKKGAVLDIDPQRVAELSFLEKKLGRNLAPMILQGADAEQVAKAKKMYRVLREQCESASSPYLKAIATLLLSEEDAEVDAKELAKQGPNIIPYLLELLKTELAFNPLYPGYAQAPVACALALGYLKAVEAIPELFVLIGNTNFLIESAALSALENIGEKAKEFCLKVLKSRPLTHDNERASIALACFHHDAAIDQACREQLQDPQVQKKEPLFSYLKNYVQNGTG